jgi:hypothetical protein
MLCCEVMISLRDEYSPDERLQPLDVEERELVKKLRGCDDIVHDWDDWSQKGFSWWHKIFKDALTPPSDE